MDTISKPVDDVVYVIEDKDKPENDKTQLTHYEMVNDITEYRKNKKEAMKLYSKQYREKNKQNKKNLENRIYELENELEKYRQVISLLKNLMNS
jgi:predicted RNase H-like nuclease (RuvC/YqgF family)